MLIMGGKMTFNVDDSDDRSRDSAVNALKRFQAQMKGEAEKAGFKSEEDIEDWITKSRRWDCNA